MDTNFSDFIDPITNAQPAGSNIEYDTRFINIQSLAEGKPEQQYGDVIIEAEEPDWNSIEKLCRQLLSESKDVRAFCLYTQALTANYGVLGFKTGCEILYKNLELYWEQIYPLLNDEDDEYDPFYRLNSMGLLTSESGIFIQLSNSKILGYSGKNGQLTIRQIISIINNNDNNNEMYPGGRDRLLQDLKVEFEAGNEELIAIKESLDIIGLIEQLFSKHLKDNFLDFSIIKKPLQIIGENMAEVSYVTEDNSQEDTLQLKVDNRSVEALTSQTVYDLKNIKISNRSDVNIILEKLILYFRLKEPSHPAPLFISRLQKLMDMDFYEIIKDISPNSVADLDHIIGKKLESDEGDGGL